MILTIDQTKLACPCCLAFNMQKGMLNALATIQFGMGEELVFNSGCRCEKHNKAVGGVSDSRHLVTRPLGACAVDIECPDPGKKWLMISLALLNGMNGIGVGENFIHMDQRAEGKAVWTYPRTSSAV